MWCKTLPHFCIFSLWGYVLCEGAVWSGSHLTTFFTERGLRILILSFCSFDYSEGSSYVIVLRDTRLWLSKTFVWISSSKFKLTWNLEIHVWVISLIWWRMTLLLSLLSESSSFLVKVLLGMASNLSTGAGTDKALYHLPVPSVQL